MSDMQFTARNRVQNLHKEKVSLQNEWKKSQGIVAAIYKRRNQVHS